MKRSIKTAPFRFASIAALAASSLALWTLPAQASSTILSSNPYGLAGSLGYDVSYPQCNTVGTYPSNNFAIVGIGDGRPFTANPCIDKLWSYAISVSPTSMSIYFNTGNSGAYGKDITSDCKSATIPSIYSTRQQKQAWEIGCSEADFAFQTALAAGVNPNAPGNGSPIGAGMWWADIEDGNSWSTNTTLNQATINGIMSELTSPQSGTSYGGTPYSAEAGVPVGIYSNAPSWLKITGGNFTPIAASADWIATTTNTCPTSFDSSQTLLYQYGTASNGGDSDTACVV